MAFGHGKNALEWIEAVRLGWQREQLNSILRCVLLNYS